MKKYINIISILAIILLFFFITIQNSMATENDVMQIGTGDLQAKPGEEFEVTVKIITTSMR